MLGAGIADVEPRSGSWQTAMPDLWQANRRGQRHATRSHSHLTAHDAQTHDRRGQRIRSIDFSPGSIGTLEATNTTRRSAKLLQWNVPDVHSRPGDRVMHASVFASQCEEPK